MPVVRDPAVFGRGAIQCDTCAELLGRLARASEELHTFSVPANLELLSQAETDTTPDTSRLDLCALLRAECEVIRETFVLHLSTHR
jgi:hypothetical protein